MKIPMELNFNSENDVSSDDAMLVDSPEKSGTHSINLNSPWNFENLILLIKSLISNLHLYFQLQPLT